jgi:hypothetical protein
MEYIGKTKLSCSTSFSSAGLMRVLRKASQRLRCLTDTKTKTKEKNKMKNHKIE